MAAVFLLVLAAAGSAAAQEGGGEPDPNTVRMRIGPFYLNPRLELANLGVDSNVFNEPADQNPKRDFTFTITPTTDIWLRLGPSWFKATIREDIVWYQQYSSERSANESYSLNWHLPLSRFVADISPTYLSTRDRPGYEIDARSQRTEYGGKASIEVRGLSRTFFGVSGSYQKVEYDKAAVFLDTNLQNELNRTSTTGAVTVRHQLTPLTSLNFNVSQSQDRFEFSSLRDSNSTGAGVTVAFDPHALIRGSASFGYRDFHPLSAGLPDYIGTTALGDLSYTLLGVTKFSVRFKRDISYSYDINQPYYLENGVIGEIAQQIFGPFDLVARGGASTLAYRDRAGVFVENQNRVDYIRSYGGGLGYHLGRDIRIGFNIDQQHRISDVTERQYDGLRYGTSVTYAF